MALQISLVLSLEEHEEQLLLLILFLLVLLVLWWWWPSSLQLLWQLLLWLFDLFKVVTTFVFGIEAVREGVRGEGRGKGGGVGRGRGGAGAPCDVTG